MLFIGMVYINIYFISKARSCRGLVLNSIEIHKCQNNKLETVYSFRPV